MSRNRACIVGLFTMAAVVISGYRLLSADDGPSRLASSSQPEQTRPVVISQTDAARPERPSEPVPPRLERRPSPEEEAPRDPGRHHHPNPRERIDRKKPLQPGC